VLVGSLLSVVIWYQWPRGASLVLPRGAWRRHALVAATTAGLFAAVVIHSHAGVGAWVGFALVTVLIPATIVDLDHRIIPNELVVLATVVATALAIVIAPEMLVERLIAAAAAGGFLLIAALAYPAGMGMGDVKLAAVLGLFLGRAVAPAMLAATLAGALTGAVIIARKGGAAGRKTAIPFGPFLAVGGLVGLFAGEPLVSIYLDSLT